ncbi:hypothetical protein MHZ92_19460 [Sporosarcina sp. ACRSL]|uniref:hypothetical protein n=1 Tax=Sporosarcina sp. ACRSL TaxID=2918215 RepID=UPI001EF706BB|nr:hypothetical protein [Sporosarcina sp. ACRSL]MCG7346290.1 hypothetical protein [Sporosarcina sp. ACRSL]
MKRFSFYFVSTVVIGYILYLAVGYQERLRLEAAETFNYLAFITPLTVFPICFGLLLRTPKLVLEMKEKKQWSFDWIKFVAIGIPSLYITMLPMLQALFGVKLLFGRVLLLGNPIAFTTIARIVFGYVLFDCLKK